VVIDFEEVFFVDETGADTLTDFFAQSNDVDQSLARVHSDAYELLKMAGIIDEIRVLNHWALSIR
jgi:anti-anti-sigma regulatory factor